MKIKTPAFETMHLEKSIDIDAPRERVFSALTKATALWWGAPYLENPEAYDLVLEPRVGGRFYESWDTSGDDREGSLLGTVVAIRRPDLLRLQGAFGLRDRAVQSTVTIELHRKQDAHHRTEVHFNHQAIGHIDETVRKRYAQGWTDLLNRLKSFVEVHKAHGVRHDPSLED